MKYLSKINIDDIQPGLTLGHADAALLRDELRELSALREGNWISCTDQMPDTTSEQRVCAYTPSQIAELRYRFVPAVLFKTVCSEATHWRYMTPPVGAA